MVIQPIILTQRLGFNNKNTIPKTYVHSSLHFYIIAFRCHFPQSTGTRCRLLVTVHSLCSVISLVNPTTVSSLTTFSQACLTPPTFIFVKLFFKQSSYFIHAKTSHAPSRDYFFQRLNSQSPSVHYFLSSQTTSPHTTTLT